MFDTLKCAEFFSDFNTELDKLEKMPEGEAKVDARKDLDGAMMECIEDFRATLLRFDEPEKWGRAKSNLEREIANEHQQ